MLFQTIYTVMGATPLDATIAVLDKGSFEHLVRVVVVKMVDDAVAEIGGEDLTYLRVSDKEASRGSSPVGSIVEFARQCDEVAIQVFFKRKLIGFVPLMTTGVVIGDVEVGKKLGIKKGERGLHNIE